MKIDQFIGRNRFLSNFYITPIEFEGDIYPSVEHAYQAAKTLNQLEREYIRKLHTPGDAKRAGKKVAIRSDWEIVKIPTMRSFVKQKFTAEPLRAKLLDTNGYELIEGNTWHDNFWGMCYCASSRCITALKENHLGRILMQVRDEL